MFWLTDGVDAPSSGGGWFPGDLPRDFSSNWTPPKTRPFEVV
jgi:hypothetical protein